MKKVVFLVLLLVVTVAVRGQVSFGGTPPSFAFEGAQRARTSAEVKELYMPFTNEELRLNDRLTDTLPGPQRVATLIPVQYTVDNSGEWSELPTGQHLWQLRIRAQGAIALMLYYRNFYLPEGGRLFIYNQDRTHVLGAYTHQTHPFEGGFATEFVSGDDITLEYVAPASQLQRPIIDIEEVAYCYNNAELQLRTSQACEVDVNCSEGNQWQEEKKGVAKMVMRIGTNSWLCSGSLVNNTCVDFIPYFLSAYHCMVAGGKIATVQDMERWVFYFHYERSACGGSSVSAPSTMTGCELKVKMPLSAGSDGLLLCLKQSIPDRYDVFYNGWDRSAALAASGVGIHHPSGDYKKISTYTAPVVVRTAYVDGEVSQAAAHIDAVFVATANGHGVTEGGSSGSPLFSQNKLIVGTLTGGNSSCSRPLGSNLYGRMYYHWNRNTNGEGISSFLDPINQGVMELPGASPTMDYPSPRDFSAAWSPSASAVELTWKAPPIQPLGYEVYRDGQLCATTSLLKYTDELEQIGIRTYSIKALYSSKKSLSTPSLRVNVPNYTYPSDIQIVDLSYNRAALTWRYPGVHQRIYWNESGPDSRIAMGGEAFYFGQKWEVSDLSGIGQEYILSLSYVAVASVPYKLYIVQGDRRWSQPISPSTVTGQTSVTLTTPFRVEPDKPLIVSLMASEYGSSFPAAIDRGPAVGGRGDIISLDGNNWVSLSSVDTKYNFNFFMEVLLSPVPYASEQPLQPSNLPLFTPKALEFNLYRNGSLLNGSPLITTQYVDSTLVDEGEYTYQVESLFDYEKRSLSPEVPFTFAATGIRTCMLNGEKREIALWEQIDLLAPCGANSVELSFTTSDGQPVQVDGEPRTSLSVELPAMAGRAFKLLSAGVPYTLRLYPLPSLLHRWDDVLTVNSNTAITQSCSELSYQWLRNNVVISDATLPYLQIDENSLGDYRVEFTTPNRQKELGCPYTASQLRRLQQLLPSSALAPSVVEIGQEVVLLEAPLGGVMRLLTYSGVLLSEYTVTSVPFSFSAPMRPGIYLVRVIAPDDNSSTYKLVVR